MYICIRVQLYVILSCQYHTRVCSTCPCRDDVCYMCCRSNISCLSQSTCILCSFTVQTPGIAAKLMTFPNQLPNESCTSIFKTQRYTNFKTSGVNNYRWYNFIDAFINAREGTGVGTQANCVSKLTHSNYVGKNGQRQQ